MTHKQRKPIVIYGLTTVLLLAAIGLGFAGLHQKSKPSLTTNLTLTSIPIPTFAATPFVAEYKLKIDKIGLLAPIVLNVPGTDEQAYLKALKDGVAHYKGTMLPGQKTEDNENGNTFIFGHSSYFKPEQFSKIFVRLNDLHIGDIFQIIPTDKEPLSYKVIRSAIVTNDDLSVLGPDKDNKEIVTLMTCWPPGTVAKRYIVQAERILPSSPTPLPTN